MKRVAYGVVFLFAGVLALFADFAYQTFSIRPVNEPMDAIVVLAGGRGRIEEGVRLYRKGGGRWLLLVGVDPVVKKGDLYKYNQSGGGAEHVVLEKVSRNTLENAIYAKEIIVARKITSIVLITSRYHMKRAELLFRSILPDGIRIVPHPVDSGNLKEEWWRHPGSFRLLVREFCKFYVYKLLFLFVSGDIHGDALRLDQARW